MFNTIEEAIEDIKNGKMVIVVDNENRENEGDLIMAGEVATFENLNFMAKLGRGLICAPITNEIALDLGLHPMVSNSTDPHGTAFTVSIDHVSNSTGISIEDRLNTIKALCNKDSRPSDFRRPGHLFPLIAKDGGVLARPGHTEAAVDLAELAGLKKVGVIVEILNDDGTMARVPDLIEFSKKYDLKLITIEALIEYRREKELIVKINTEARMPTQYGSFRLIGFDNNYDNKEHIALVKGNVEGKENVKLRIHSECFTGDILGSLRCDCGDQLHETMKRIDEIGEGVILYMRQEGRGIGLYNKLKAYNLQDEGFDTVEANLKLGFADDEREYLVAAKMIEELGIKSVSLITNNPDKIEKLKELGVNISNREEIIVNYHEENKHYMKTKVNKMRHLINFNK